MAQSAHAPLTARDARYDENNLVWVDMEMSGLNPDVDRILEVAMVVTDAQLTVLAIAPVVVLHQPDSVLDGMDAWNKSTHGKSGLIDKVRASTTSESQASALLLDFIRGYVPAGKAPMCGNTVHQDRRFMQRYMPQLESFFHYRNIDVSTIKELCRRWNPSVMKGFEKQGAHTALADIQESIEELRFYRNNWIEKSSA